MFSSSLLDLLTPHNGLLDLAASPLGAALRRVPLLSLSLDDADLSVLALEQIGNSEGQRRTIRGRHSAGFELRVEMQAAPDQQVLIWDMTVSQAEQPAGQPQIMGPRLHAIQPLRLDLDGGIAPDLTIHSWLGGAQQTFFPPDAITPQSRVLYPRTVAHYQSGEWTMAARAGRSSDFSLPYFLLSTEDDSGGLWCAIGWSGQWQARFVKPLHSLDLQVEAQIDPGDLRLPPGTRLRLPSMALGLYRGDYAAGCHALRGWLRSQMPPLPQGGDLAHFNTWTAMDADVDEEKLLSAVERVAGHGLRYFMLDAGWYPGPRTEFPAGVGNWSVDQTKFPHGLEVVAERVRERGMGMGLWFEPERAHLTSELARVHPEWLLTTPERAHGLVNFALPDVRAFFREVIGDLARRLDLGWLKWDCNIDPLPYWQAAADGGLAHLGHVDGVWEVFDWIRTTFPNIVLENCASGGNRLDWTLFTRSTVNFANDQYTQPDCIRRILGRMAAPFPTERLNMIFGPAQRRDYGDDAWQVLLGSCFGVSEPVNNWTPEFSAGLRRHLAIHRQTQAARSEDFYRLTPDTPELPAWESWQWHDPASDTGIVALWRCGAVAEHYNVRLCAVSTPRRYTVRDLSSGAAFEASGAQLRDGLPVSLSLQGATVWSYAAITAR